MVFFFDHMVGDNDFASNFASVAEEKREAEERRQAEFILKLLDELENQADSSNSNPDEKFERMVAIDDEGYIYKTKESEEAERKKFHNKVHTIKDLPYESEWEMIFGPQPEPEPAFDVKKGRRVVDGRKVHMLKPTQPDGGPARYWTGASPFTIFCIAIGVLFALLAIIKMLSKSKKKQVPPTMKTLPIIVPHGAPQVDMKQLDYEINKRVKYHMKKLIGDDFK